MRRLLRWLRQVVTSPVTPRYRCPHCGEDRLVERDQDGRGYCAVCGRTWIEAEDEARERRRLDRLVGGDR